MGLWDQPAWIYIWSCHCGLWPSCILSVLQLVHVENGHSIRTFPQGCCEDGMKQYIYIQGRIVPGIWFVINEHKLSL